MERQLWGNAFDGSSEIKRDKVERKKKINEDLIDTKKRVLWKQ